MVALVTLDNVKDRLKFDGNEEDLDLTLMIQGASEAVLNYLGLAHTVYDDSNGNAVDVPAAVVNAVLMLIGILKRDSDGADMKGWEMGYLPFPVTALLYPLRDPVVA